MLYQPQIREDQVKSIYKIKEETNRPMTKILQEAVDLYLSSKQGSEGRYIITLNPLLDQEIAAHIISKDWKLNSNGKGEVRDFLFERLFIALDDCKLVDGIKDPLLISNNPNGKEIRTSVEYIKQQLDYAMQDALDCPYCCKNEKFNCLSNIEHADMHTGNARDELEKLL